MVALLGYFFDLFCPFLPAVRQQINAITAYIDASFVYGSSNEKMNELREKHGKILILSAQQTHINTCAIRVYPDETACNEDLIICQYFFFYLGLSP